MSDSETKTVEIEIDPRPWSEFRESGLLWWTNRMLHLFGWSIVFTWDGEAEGEPMGVYPARVPFKGFIHELEEQGFANLEAHLRKTFGPVNEYEPDEVSLPWESIKEALDEKGLDPMELGLPEGLQDGSAAVTPELAEKLGEVIGPNAKFWLRHEAGYRKSLAK